MCILKIFQLLRESFAKRLPVMCLTLGLLLLNVFPNVWELSRWKALPMSSHCWIFSLLQIREGLPTELPLHWQLPDSVPPFTRESPFLLPEAGQGTMGLQVAAWGLQPPLERDGGWVVDSLPLSPCAAFHRTGLQAQQL